MKLLTIVIPAYNSEAYLEDSVLSAVAGGDETDVLIIDDGSKDRTGEIADSFAEKYPGIVRVIHQENGGHGEGLNQGIRNAQGIYLKNLDSDDSLDPAALKGLLDLLRKHTAPEDQADIVINDYYYDRKDGKRNFAVSYRHQLRTDMLMTWDTVRRFPMWKQFMIHSLTYRTEMLREHGLVLPKHTSYEDNLYIFRPLPWTKKILYLNMPLYGYRIGREDQSINENVIIRKMDQVTEMCAGQICSYTMKELDTLPPKLRSYMINHMAGQLLTTCSLQYITEKDGGLEWNRKMLDRIEAFDPALMRCLRKHFVGRISLLPGKAGRRFVIFLYRAGRKLARF